MLWSTSLRRAAEKMSRTNTVTSRGAKSRRSCLTMNKLEDFEDVFAGVQPWSGVVPKGFSVDFLGTLTDVTFRQAFMGDPMAIAERYVKIRLPSLDESGEWWFETVNWFAAAREASDRFVMVTLGAWHGSQAVGSHRALQQVNPTPCKLVAVEPVPENVALVRRHFQNNDIDPDAHWIVPTAITPIRCCSQLSRNVLDRRAAFRPTKARHANGTIGIWSEGERPSKRFRTCCCATAPA